MQLDNRSFFFLYNLINNANNTIAHENPEYQRSRGITFGPRTTVVEYMLDSRICKTKGTILLEFPCFTVQKETLKLGFASCCKTELSSFPFFFLRRL